MPVRSRNLGIAPRAAQFVRGIIVLCRVIYGHLLSYRYPQPYSLSCRVVTSVEDFRALHQLQRERPFWIELGIGAADPEVGF